MNILIQLGHPAHFHLYKNTIKNLQRDGHQVYILIKTKDILEQLLIDAGLPYVNIYSKVRKKSKFAIIKATLTRLWRITLFTLRHHIDLLTGSSTEIAQVGWLLRRHSVILGEDDAAIIPEFISLAKPFMDSYLAPAACNMGKLEHRVTKYQGYQKLAYLHPNCFTPNRIIASKYVDLDRPYFILRFTNLRAYHDLHAAATGITTEIARKIISLLEPKGKVYITSERKLESELENYRLSINPLDIHHVLSYCSIYIGDSQSMAVESALLGVPNIRFNDFVGKIGVLNELENKYHLTIGIPASNPETLYKTLGEMLRNHHLKEEYQERRSIMLKDVIDVNAFYTWFFENYPASKKKMKDNPDYQLKFK
jgi:predicted glycosyltransferase